MKTTAVILAAGQGTRMKSKLPKVLHQALGKPMVQWVLDCLDHAGVQHKIAVLEVSLNVSQCFREIFLKASSKFFLDKNPQYPLFPIKIGQQAEIVYQKEQLGTGHAVMQAAPALPAENDCVLVICGDTPLLRPQTIAQLIARHEAEGNAVTLLTAHAENPTGYGRIVRQGEQIAAIVEQKDADVEQCPITWPTCSPL